MSKCESLRGLSWIDDPHGSSGNQQFISLRCALTFAQSVQSVSGCLGMRRESCRIEWCDAAGPIEPGSTMSRSGRKCTKKKRRIADCSIRQESLAGAKRNDIISPTNNLVRHGLAEMPPTFSHHALLKRGPAMQNDEASQLLQNHNSTN